MNAIGNMGDNLSWLNKISVFGVFNAAKIINGSYNILIPAIGFTVGGLILYGASIYIFNNKDLPL